MGLPYQSEDYDEAGSGSASTVNDLGGMNFSTLDNNELMKRVDANNVGGSGITAVETTSGASYDNKIKTFVGSNELASITTAFNAIGNYKNMQLKPDNSISAANGVNIQSVPASTETRIGINVQDPEEALDIEGNIELRGGAGKIFFKHPSGLQKVELDGDQDGTNGGKFIVKTKVDGGSMTQKLEINNDGAIGLGASPDYGVAGNFLMSLGSGSLPEWFVPTSRIITSVKKTSSQSFASGGLIKITGWDTPHVDIGTTGWSNVNSRYTIQRTATYRIDLKAIISNELNEQSALRYLNVGIYIYNSGGGTPVFQDLDTTTLVNVDNTTGRIERGSGDYSIIRTLNATQYIEFQVGSLQGGIGNFNVESAVVNIEEVGASYVAGVGQFLPLTGGTVTGSITAPTYKTSVIPTLTNEIGYNNSIAIATGITLPKYNVAPFYVSLGSHTLNSGVYIVYGSFTTDGFATYGTTAILHDGTNPITENFTVVVPGGFTSSYVSNTIVVPVGTTKTIEFRANVNATTSPAVTTIYDSKYNVVRIA